MAGVGGMSRIADRNHFGLLGEPFDQRRCGALVAFKARIERPDAPVDEIAIVRTRAVPPARGGGLELAVDGIASGGHRAEQDRKSTRLNYSHVCASRMTSSA